VNSLQPPRNRRIYCNRTLNLRGLGAVGFDMDYTLVTYHTDVWEGRAFNYVKERLKTQGWPVDDLKYLPELCTLGLIVDTQLGNVLKADHFGHVRLATHGTRALAPEQLRATYGHVPIDLADKRWRAVDTLFGLSETSFFMQLVDRFDERPFAGVVGYVGIHRAIRHSLDAAHMEGELKSAIVKNPSQFVKVDEDLPLALLDLKHSGKKLLLITNSEWSYTNAMMSYVLDSRLPHGQTWRSLFNLVFVQARKPNFFSEKSPALRLVDDRGYFEPTTGKLRTGEVYLGGNASLVEESLGLPGEDFLYFGDHIFADVYVSKDLLRWRTALVVSELEDELLALDTFHQDQDQLSRLMSEKTELEHRYSQHRLALQRQTAGYGPAITRSADTLKVEIRELRAQLTALDTTIAPLARRASHLQNERWGLLMRAGNDRSHLARQIERYADIYTSRVSNLLAYSPYVYLRASRASVPHDGPQAPAW
jgi:HAD superfamily 5'-nucleotidase-like hydrolase